MNDASPKGKKMKRRPQINNRRKIVIVDRSGAFSIWTLMNAIAAAAVESGHEVIQVVLDTDAETVIEQRELPRGVRVVPIMVASGRSRFARLSHALAFARQFASLLGAEQPDVVQTNFADPGIVARLVARLMGVPFVVTTYHELHGSLNRAYRGGLAATARCADRHVYVSQTCARSFGHADAPVAQADDALPDDRHIVIRNGFEFRPPTGVEAGTREDRLPLIVCAGRLMPEKGQALLVEAVRQLAAEGVLLRLELFGDGPSRPALEQQIEAAGLSGWIALVGWQAHATVMAAFARADAVVLPSDGTQESFGLALAEALAVANRVVASDIEAFIEVAQGLGLGMPPAGTMFFARREVQSLASVLGEALQRQPGSEELARRKQATIERYDLERMARCYIGIYSARWA